MDSAQRRKSPRRFSGRALDASPRAPREFFHSLDGANRYAVLFPYSNGEEGVENAWARKIREFVDMLERNENIQFNSRKTRRQSE